MYYAFQQESPRFPKSERLSSKKLIRELFSKGKVKKYKDVRFYYLRNPVEQEAMHQVLFSIPARNFKKAVHRNRIKRQLRECYRLNKQMLYKNTHPVIPYLLAYVYISSYLPFYKDLEKQVTASFEYLLKTEFPTHEKQD